MAEQICNYGIMVNALFRARLSGDRRPDQTSALAEAGPGPTSLISSEVTCSSTNLSRVPVSQGKINNKINIFSAKNKNFLTIFHEHFGSNECSEPRR
jgi:hypothetical protein